MQAHIQHRGVVMDIAAFKVSNSVDIDAAALRAARARSKSIGAMDECLGKGRRRAHISRGIRIHIGVGQRCRARDVESPTLPAKRTSAFQLGSRGRWMKVQ